MEWSIQDLARAAGTTSRTLRHYGQLGLLAPSRVGSNGYRYYDRDSLVRLQRILLLRELGLGLPVIAEVLAGQRDTAAAMRIHLDLLEQERSRIGRQITSVRTTLQKMEGGEELMATEAFDGFDHAQYEDEVVARWGRKAWDDGNSWWSALGAEGQQAHRAEHEAIAAGLGTAAASGADPADPGVQDLVARHHAWVSSSWTPDAEAYLNLGRMYVDDPRFTATYDAHGADTAAFLLAAITVYSERTLA